MSVTNQITLPISQASKKVVRCLRAGLVPQVLSAPGLGKSAMVHQIAKELNLKVIDIRMAQMDPTEFNGFPSVTEVNGVKQASYIPMDIFPLEDTPLPEGKAGWLMFFDEATNAPRATQGAAFKVVLDRMIGNAKLHTNVCMVLAGNRIEDMAAANVQVTAMTSRLVHFTLEVDKDDWLKWAMQSGIDKRVIAYIGNFGAEKLHDFKPENSGPFPCPRAWEMVSRLIKNQEITSGSHLEEIAGAIGEGPARNFLTWIELFDEIPSIEEIVANPTGAALPTNRGVEWAMATIIGEAINSSNADPLITYVKRLEPEMAVIALRLAVAAKGRELLSVKPVTQLLIEHGIEYGQ